MNDQIDQFEEWKREGLSSGNVIAGMAWYFIGIAVGAIATSAIWYSLVK